MNQIPEQTEVGLGRYDQVHDTVGRKSFACLLEQWGDVCVIRSRAPRSISDVPRFAGTERRINEDDVEMRARRHGGKEIGSNRNNAIPEAIGSSVLSGGCGRNGVDIDRHGPSRTGTQRRQRLNAGARTQIRDDLARKIELIDEFGKNSGATPYRGS